MSLIYKKICLVGDLGVGKTSLVRRFVESKFSDEYLTTVGVKISRKVVEVPTERRGTPKNVTLVIWDIEGKSKFNSIAHNYLQGAAGAIVVGDFTRQETIEHIREHLKLLLAVNGQQIKIVVALNKSDLVNRDTAKKIFLANQFSDIPQVVATYITSAKTGNNVNTIFSELNYTILEQA